MKRLIAIVLFLGLALARASADPAAPKSSDAVLYPRGTAGAEAAEHPSAGPGFGSLAIGVVLAAGGCWLLWRKQRDARQTSSRGKLNVAETKSLGNKQYLVVATYGDQKFLLGVCPGKIDLLAPLEISGAKDL